MIASVAQMFYQRVVRLMCCTLLDFNSIAINDLYGLLNSAKYADLTLPMPRLLFDAMGVVAQRN